MSSKISVAIPTYNRIDYLKECIQSILEQTFQDFSIFVFDNASSEPVQEELQKYGDERIHVVGSEINLGSTGNINRILQYPFESPYVIIFHDDDTMHPELLRMEVSFMDSHTDALFVVSDLQRKKEGTMQNFTSFPKEHVPHSIFREQDFVRAQMKWLRYAFNSALFRTEALRHAKMKPEIFSDFADMVLLAEISKKGVCAFLAVPLVNYRVHEGQDSGNMKKEHIQGALAMLAFFRESLPTPLSQQDNRLLRIYSLNFLFRTYAQTGKSIIGFFGFLQVCRRQGVLLYKDMVYLDARGAVSLLSILFGNKKIIDAARWVGNLFRS